MIPSPVFRKLIQRAFHAVSAPVQHMQVDGCGFQAFIGAVAVISYANYIFKLIPKVSCE